jgi:acetyl esterase/lipase
MGVLAPFAAADKASFEVEVVKDISYAGKDGDRQQLDLYLPKGARDYPVFFFIHGGG